MPREGNIRVICRVRPQNSSELARCDHVCVEFPSDTQIKVDNNKFNFDRVFQMGTTQQDIFNEIGDSVADDILQGFNSTIFAYGQTSSGKTFTMQGADNGEFRGLIPRIIEKIFDIASSAPDGCEFTIKASYLEIYLERIRDLLDSSKVNLNVREGHNGVYVEGATEMYIATAKEAETVLEMGQASRVIAETKMNAVSSRSHSVFMLNVTQKTPSKTISSRLSLVDLAGSEKVGKTGASGTTLDEAKKINLSLSALGNVINALTDGKSTHIPYRDSKLTRLLQDSLGGNASTTLIICCSPSEFNKEETISTCRFGARAKTVKNVAKANVTQSVEELRALLGKALAEIERLKKSILRHRCTHH